MLRKALPTLLTVTILFGIMSGCESKEQPSLNEATAAAAKDGTPSYMNATGFPIVKEPVTVKILRKTSAASGNFKDMEVFKKMEKLTGIHIEFDGQNTQSYSEKMNLIFASGDLPDVVLGGFNSNVTEEELYGRQGMLLPLENFIDKYAPYFKKLSDQQLNVKRAVATTDGHIFSLPYVVSTKTSANTILYINMDWLEKVNMSKPATVDEFYNVLKAFKEKDPNGNGKADEISVSYWRQTNIWRSIFDQTILNAFSGQAGGTDFDIRDGKVIYNPIQPYFKEYLSYMKKLYEEKLLDNEMFTQTQQQMVSKYKEGRVGISTLSLSSVLNPGDTTPYELIPPLTSSLNSKKVTPELRYVTTGVFAITKACKYPEAMVRWADVFFRDYEDSVEGVSGLSMFLGIYGENWSFTDEEKTKYSRVSKDPALNPQEYFTRYVSPQGFGKVVTDALPDNEPFLLLKATESDKQYFPFMTEIYPYNARYTKEENERMALLSNDINTYVGQMIGKFILGDESLDKWDDYVNDLKKLNIDELTKIKQDAYERWEKTK